MATLDRLLGIALANAAAAIVLALVAAAVDRFARRPAAAHALWVLVLLKLVTPPVWTVPIKVAVAPMERSRTTALFAPAASRSTPPADSAAGRNDFAEPVNGFDDSPTIDATEIAAAGPANRADATTVLPLPARHPGMFPSAVATAAPIPTARAYSPASAWARWEPLIATFACAAWVAGTAAFLTIVVVRVLRFRRCLRYAMPAPAELQNRAAALSAKMSVRRCPPVWLVPGAVSPMLWALGTARVLVPTELWERLDDGERDSLLAHELAHLRRRDHWVRWLEVLATAAYWWHPVCWWARRALREAEEQCCDAWVLWARPGGLQSYAAALLETLDFLSARPGSDPPDAADRGFRLPHAPVRTSVPLLASGMGQFHQLKRRFVMLRQGDVPRALTRGGLMAVFTLGGLLLPVVPTFAQVLTTPATPATPAVPPTPAATPAPKVDSVTPADDGSAREDDDERSSKAKAADRQKLDELKRARDFEQSVRDKMQQADLQKQLAESKAEVQKLAAALAQAQDRLRQLERSAGVRSDGAKSPDGGITSMKPGVGIAKDWTVDLRRAKSNYSGDAGDRLDAIEQQLQGLLKEVKSMRAERKAEEKGPRKSDGKPTEEKGYWKNDGKPKDGPPSAPPPPTPAPELRAR